MYCWECLLFATDRHGVWSHTGFVNLTCLTKTVTRHQSTAGHLQATVLSKTFGETRVDLQLSEQVRRETELHNEKVKKNREWLLLNGHFQPDSELKHARNTAGQARLSALASMAIEKGFLMELKRTDNLYDRIIELFLRKERRMGFVYK